LDKKTKKLNNGIMLEGITNGEGTAKLYLQEVMLAAAGSDID
jgi:mannan endo-1,4-beta-mannosidase